MFSKDLNTVDIIPELHSKKGKELMKNNQIRKWFVSLDKIERNRTKTELHKAHSILFCS